MTWKPDFFKNAKRIADGVKDQRRQFGAVIAKGSHVVSMSRNFKHHPNPPRIQDKVSGRKYYGIHAEVGALLRAREDVKGATIYVYGCNSNSKNNVYAKPCVLCEMMLTAAGVRNAIFNSQSGIMEYNFKNKSLRRLM